MPKQVIQADRGAPALGAYSQGFSAGGFVFVTGTAPVDETGTVTGETVAEQTRLVIENVQHVLEAAGGGLKDVVKSMVYLRDSSYFQEYNAVYAEYFSEPRPVRTTIGVDMGQVPGMMVEMDVIAYIGD